MIQQRLVHLSSDLRFRKRPVFSNDPVEVEPSEPRARRQLAAPADIRIPEDDACGVVAHAPCRGVATGSVPAEDAERNLPVVPDLPERPLWSLPQFLRNIGADSLYQLPRFDVFKLSHTTTSFHVPSARTIRAARIAVSSLVLPSEDD